MAIAAEKNINRVPKKQWKEWSDAAKAVFNRMYDFIYDNQELTIHPKMAIVTDKQWKTVAWNVAWIAADAVDNTIPDEVVTV